MVFKKYMHNLVYLILIIALKASAQKASVCGEILYKQETNFSMYYERNFLMAFNNKESYYEETNIKASRSIVKNEYSEDGLTKKNLIGRKNLTPSFYYNNKNDFYFMEMWFDEPLTVKEAQYQLIWKLYPETKKIGSFLCTKATTRFRGRDYIAWFTNKIPVPFGPWKFKDLPGLILEVYDTDNVFHILAQKIKITKALNCYIDFDTIKVNSPLTIRTYLKRIKELVNEDLARISSKMGRTKTLRIDESCDDCSESIELFKKEN